ncbi:MAG: hypothetical protein ACREGJ_01035 [Candidatus Saccharimonadales bacterium]
MAFPSRVAHPDSPYGWLPECEYNGQTIKSVITDYQSIVTGSETKTAPRVTYGWENGAFVVSKIPDRVPELAKSNGHNGKIHKLGSEVLKLNGTEKPNGTPQPETLSALGGIAFDPERLAASS